jgi:manganese transport protein
MGDLVNRRLTSVLATAGAAAILCLNVVLLVETIGVPLPAIR